VYPVVLGLLIAASSPPATDYLGDWGAARAREFEAAENPLAEGPKGPLFEVRPNNAQLKDFSAPASLSPLIQAVSAGVVNISASGASGPPGSPAPARSLGSGFILDPDGYVLTNNHVVADAEQIQVKLADGREFTAQVVGKDASVDLALLHLNGDLKDLPFVYLGDSDKLEVGDWVVAIGTPFGLDHTVSHGMISAKERVLGVGAFDDFLQTDALINPGNSGGPLFDMKGDVIGVNTAVLTRSQGIGFAVPINLVKELLPNLKVNGHLARGWLGVTAKEEPEGKGAVIEDVYAGSPAALAGLKGGDRISAVNGHPVESYLQLLREIALLPPGSRTRFTVIRGSTPREIQVNLSERPAPETMHTLAELQQAEPAGLALEDVTPALANRLGLPVGQGAWVAGVVPGSLADRTGLREGDVIASVNGQPVADVAGYLGAMQSRPANQPATLGIVRAGRDERIVVQ
jgi:serine protease Do